MEQKKQIEQETIHVAFVGNPNCGKTTLFNAITGAKLKVANWPGVTVEKKEGRAAFEGQTLAVIDTPGIYSLTCYTIEERVTRQCVMDDDIEVIVNVVDASSLERNLYLTLQLLELGKPVVLALNMIDVVEEQGMELDLHRLPEMLGGIPVIPVSAVKRTGLGTLLHAVVHHYEEGFKELPFGYGPVLEEKIHKLEAMMDADFPNHSSPRWHAIKLLEHDEEVMEEHPLADVKEIADRSYEKEIIGGKYAYIENIVSETVFHKQKKVAATDRIDRVMTHRIFGIPIFLGIMALVFILTFTLGDWLKGWLELLLARFSEVVTEGLVRIHTAEFLISLLVDGIIAGVGGILSFLPNIAILFLALALLEDSGYMARVAYLMDSVMSKAGLSGKAFLPMILGFGCTVPAVMATRALETEYDRKKTMVVTPFMSCSARLPIYVFFSELFFEKYHYLAAFSMYVIGMVVAVIVAFTMNLLQKRQENEVLLIELPEYKRPNLRTLRIYVFSKLKDYITKAGTTIFIASVVIWVLLNMEPHGLSADPANSFGAAIGRFLVPVLKPAGLGCWQIGVALLSGVSAKEVVVSSFAVLFGAGTGDSAILNGIRAVYPTFGALNAYCFMLFCLLYVPCVATIATIRKESNSRRFTLMVVGFQLILAWCISTLVFQIGSLIV